MKIIHVSASDVNGGAARAAYRIHKSLGCVGVQSEMWVNNYDSGDWTVTGPSNNLQKGFNILRPQLVKPLLKLFSTENPILHSLSILPSSLLRRINSSNADIVHLHWVQSEMLSISDISKINKPLIWTLHDMWSFSGAEHVAYDDRWRDGYNIHNRPKNESGIDLNRWTWLRKKKHWQTPMQIVCPSNWLAECVKSSALMHNWPVKVIPNTLDFFTWKPIDKQFARDLLGLPKGVKLLSFGSFKENDSKHKGFDLLEEALLTLAKRVDSNSLELIIFGQHAPKSPPSLGFKVHYIGHVRDDLSLRAIYSSSDAFVLPSRIDNFPNTAIEAFACGAPVIAFDTCGLKDLVSHKVNGYLAKSFDTRDLAFGIYDVVFSKEGVLSSEDIRSHAEIQYSYSVISEKYKDLYHHILSNN